MIYTHKERIQDRIDTLYKNVNDLKNGKRCMISHYDPISHLGCHDRDINSFIEDLIELDKLVKSEYQHSIVSFDNDGYLRLVGLGKITEDYKNKLIDKYLKEISELEEKLSKFDNKDYEVYLQLKERFEK